MADQRTSPKALRFSFESDNPQSQRYMPTMQRSSEVQRSSDLEVLNSLNSTESLCRARYSIQSQNSLAWSVPLPESFLSSLWPSICPLAVKTH